MNINLFTNPRICVALTVIVLSLAGCSDFHHFSGTVTFEDNTPLTMGMVIFEKSDPPFQSVGEINHHGKYEVSSLRQNDGLPAGEYAVYIVGTTFIGNDNKEVQLIDKTLTEVSTSNLRCSVPSKGNKYDITVFPPKKSNAKK